MTTFGSGPLPARLADNAGLDEVASDDDGPEALSLAAATRAQLAAAIERLPGHHREIIALAFVAELSQPEIADVLGVPVGTVKSRLLRTLPTDPGRLRDWLEVQVRDDSQGAIRWCPTDTASCSREAEIFQATAALLASPIAPPKLRSALFTVLAGLRGVHLDGTRTDDAGRPATTVSITTGHLRYELFFDAETATLLANRQVLVTREVGSTDPQWTGAAPGTVVRSVLYLKTHVVAAVGAQG